MKATFTLKEQLNSYLDQLSEQDQERVRAYARHLAHIPGGIPTQECIEFFRQFPLTDEEQDDMRRIMEEIDR